jgi:hypothetical protein
MYAILNVLENGVEKTLCFATKEDAESFKQFVNIYMEESGAGNGYETYWVFANEEIIQVNKLSRNFSTAVNSRLLNSMLKDILFARTADYEHQPEIGVYSTHGNTPIQFKLTDDLPPRQRPKAGDMFRTLWSYKGKYMEGRVLEDRGSNLVVINSIDEEEDGSPKKGSKKYTIRAKDVMKINDWRKQRRETKNVA